MFFDDNNKYDKYDEYDEEIDDFDKEEQGSCDCGHGNGHEHDFCDERPSCMCMIMGIKIMKSAVAFENCLCDYLKCQCKIIRKLIRNEQYEIIDNVLKQMSDNLQQIYKIETQVIAKLEKGAIISDCLEPEG